MAKRGGKAASRQSRQKRAQRAAQQRAAQRPPSASGLPSGAPSPASPAAPGASEPFVGPGGDAFEKADAEVRAATAPPGASAATLRSRPRRPEVPRFGMLSGSSRLSERAVAEYHYVVRDLRNIGVLVAALAVLLVVATLVVNLLGIGQA